MAAPRPEAKRACFWVGPRDGGSVTLFGKEANFRSAGEAVQCGFGMLPEDRKNDGLLLRQSIRINTTLASMRRSSKSGFIRHKNEKERVKELLASLQAKYHSTEDTADSLSGGNQQKIALAKWIMVGCRVRVFDVPTRGVDGGAKTEIYRFIIEMAENGVAVIFISSEMTEIIGMCDRVLVMRQGRVAGEVHHPDITEENLIKLSMGVE